MQTTTPLVEILFYIFGVCPQHGCLQEIWAAFQQSGINSFCKCATHGKCQLRSTMGDVSGSPCQLWSQAGKRKRAQSPLIILLLVWCFWARLARPLVLIHENVKGFDKRFLQRFLGDLYQIVVLAVSPQDANFTFSKRSRSYSVLYLTHAVRERCSIEATYERVKEAFADRQVHVPASACFVASAEDVLQAENRQRRRHRFSLRPHGLEACPSQSPARAPEPGWAQFLTANQLLVLKDYEDEWWRQRMTPPESDPDCVFDLSQTGHRKRMTCKKGQLPTTTTNSSRFWAPSLRRWLLPKEIAASQGFPVSPSLAAAAGVATDCRCYTVGDIGNSMNVANVGCVQAVALACLSKV